MTRLLTLGLTLTLLGALLSAGCGTAGQATNGLPPDRDSIAITERIQFDTITLPGAAAAATFKMEIDSTTGLFQPNTVTHLSGDGRAEVTASVDREGQLTVDCECREWRATVENREREISRWQTRHVLTEATSRSFDRQLERKQREVDKLKGQYAEAKAEGKLQSERWQTRYREAEADNGSGWIKPGAIGFGLGLAVMIGLMIWLRR